MLPDASLTYYQQQQKISVLTAATLKRLFGRMGDDFDSSWAGIRSTALSVLVAGQLSAARASVGYVDTVLAETGQDGGDIAGAVDPSAFAGYASDGRDLGTLLDQAPVIAKATVGRGGSATDGLASASKWLTMIGLTQVADASRGFISADMGAHTKVTGYVRMLTPPSCNRCVVLAGKWFRYNQGFQRHPQCFPAGVVVSGPAFDAATRRWYEGELTVIHTASGQRLSVTGNHPVLTDQGWIPANLIAEGSRVVRSTLGEGAAPLVVPDEQHRPTAVEDVWGAGRVRGLQRVPTTPEDFHGDGLFGEVDVVPSDRALRRQRPAAIGQPVGHQLFSTRLDSSDPLQGLRVSDLPLLGHSHAEDGGMSRRDLGGTSFGTHLLRTGDTGFGSIAGLNSLFNQAASHGASTDPQTVAEAVLRLPGSVRLDRLVPDDESPARWDAPSVPFSVQSRGAYASRGKDLRLRLSGQVELDRVVEVERTEFRGHVYNISSSEGWFSANGLIVSNCDCRHIPATEDIAGDLTTDPYAYFHSLTKEQQEATFGRIEARAIADGGDIYRVVNISQRGMPVAGSKQAIRYGTPRRVTVDQIYRTAGTRARAIQMMKDEGYITGEQVAGGNILGNGREGFGQLGKGGRARAASDAAVAARRTGVRDPLNRYTMTAAERRLYDAKTRLDAAERGVYLNSVGANSADKFNRTQAPTASQLASLRRNYANELDRLRGNPAKGVRPAPASVQRLAAALGIRP